MKKFLAVFLCFIILLGLCACSREAGTQAFPSNKYVDFEVVEDGAYYTVFVDRDTGVLYLWYKDASNYGQTMTPLYYADGTLKNIADFE